ncbi:hypothetical protein, partial [Mycobacterium sp.]|uniref:hypothetical protein n=1 Tax=Mycobacterium sp. TaxID=1785 RepID=UPI003C78686D
VPGPAAPAERPAPSTEATRAMQEAHGEGDEETTAIPVQRPAAGGPPTGPKPDPESTEKLPAQKPGGDERRRGGGLSAQDLLRREGRRL